MNFYSPPLLAKKVKKLSPMYDMRIPRDVLTLTMQEMEIAEAKALSMDLEQAGAEKKKAVLSVLEGVAGAQVAPLDFLEWASAYIDDMAVATKCKYAINKEQS